MLGRTLVFAASVWNSAQGTRAFRQEDPEPIPLAALLQKSAHDAARNGGAFHSNNVGNIFQSKGQYDQLTVLEEGARQAFRSIQHSKCFGQSDFKNSNWGTDNTCTLQPCSFFRVTDPYWAYCLKMACANTERVAWCNAGGSGVCRSECAGCPPERVICFPSAPTPEPPPAPTESPTRSPTPLPMISPTPAPTPLPTQSWTPLLMPLPKAALFSTMPNNSPASHIGVMVGVATLFVMGIVMSTFTYTRHASDDISQNSLKVQMVVLFTCNLAYTLVIPSSYSLSKAIGQDAVYSGLLIGVYQAGALIGAVLMWMVFQRRPSCWRYRTAMLATVCCNLAGAMVFLLAVVEVESRSLRYIRWLPWVLCFARCVDGVGLGILLQFGQVAIIHIIPSADRPRRMSTNQVFAMLGIGFGPGIYSLLNMANAFHAPFSSVDAVDIGIAYVGIHAGAFLSVFFLHPISVDCEDFQPPLDAGCGSADSSRSDFRRRALVIIGSLVMTGQRGFVVSGLEAATALLLEAEYKWHLSNIGIAIGASFLTIIPLIFTYAYWKDTVTIVAWIRMMLFAALFGSSMLFNYVPLGKDGQSFSLLGADGILFATMFLGDALTSGLMMMSQHIFPNGSWLDANHVVLYKEMFKGIGRTIGPPLARWNVVSGGQNAYAAQQIIIAVFFLGVFETLVVPNVRPAE